MKNWGISGHLWGQKSNLSCSKNIKLSVNGGLRTQNAGDEAWCLSFNFLIINLMSEEKTKQNKPTKRKHNGCDNANELTRKN